jgi:hypothetical protein
VLRIGSLQGRTGDALALEGDEGRVKLRKAVGSCKKALYPQMSEWGNLTT